MDFISTLDPLKLVFAETILSFFLSPVAAPYNLPIFLFGTYAHESRETTASLQMFTSLVGASALLDIFWMFGNEQSGLLRLLTIILFLLKIPTFLSSVAVLRERGSHFGQITGSQVWSMPGGLSLGGGGEGYQVVDEGLVRPSKYTTTVPSNSSRQAQDPPGAYQTV